MEKVILIILFNHKFERNLQRLRELYASRFDHICFIMPFYKGTDADVITVYEHSYIFQGYLAQALKEIKKKQYNHYLIIGDDLLLHPDINQHNYKQYFKVDEDTAFIPGIYLLDDETRLKENEMWFWYHNAMSFRSNKPGVEVQNELPDFTIAAELLKKHGYNFNPYLSKRLLVEKVPKIKNKDDEPLKIQVENVIGWFRLWIKYSFRSRRKLHYPMVGSYSDAIVIPHACIDSFTHYCGVFAALDLFVEIAIPTALLFAAKRVVQEKDLQYKGRTFWGDEDITTMEKQYNNNLENLFINFPKDTLYIHPVKLSRWK